MEAMTPFAYSGDMSKQFDAARFMLGESDATTARIRDVEITSTLDAFGWQGGMVVLSQMLIVSIGQEVLKMSEQSGPAYEWAQQRLDGLKSINAQAQRGTLPDPDGGQIVQIPGSMQVANKPGW